MSYDLVVTFGDSWPAGAELNNNEKTFGELVAESYNAKFYNFAELGTSNFHLMLQLKKFLLLEEIKNKNILAIFFITNYSRLLVIENGKIKSVSVHNEDEYYKTFTDDSAIFMNNILLSSLQHLCKSKNISDKYIFGWIKFAIDEIVDENKFYNKGQTTCLNMFKVNENDPTDDPNFIYYDHNHYIRPNVCHPNQLGHRTIANNLINWINNAKN